MEAQLLLQMRQLRGDTRAAEKRLSSSKARKHVEICRDMGAELDVVVEIATNGEEPSRNICLMSFMNPNCLNEPRPKTI